MAKQKINSAQNGLLVVDYTVPTNTTSITINGLDLVAHGGVYELIVQGGGVASDPVIVLNGNEVASNWMKTSYGQSVGTFYGTNNVDNSLPTFRIDTEFTVDYLISRSAYSGRITIIGTWANGTTVVGGNFIYTNKLQSKSAISNVTSLVINGGNTIYAGTRIMIMRKF